MPNRQTIYQARQRVAGLCRRCRNPAAPNARTGRPSPYCESCRRKASAAEARRRQAQRETLDAAARRAAALESGLCAGCGAPLTLTRRAGGQEFCVLCQPSLC